MGLFDVSEEKKRGKEIKKEGRSLRKELVAAGLEKKWVDAFLELFFACLERAYSERLAYESARAHMDACLGVIDELLPKMREIETANCKACLQKMLLDLPQIYHDCFIRRDDLDYQSTLSYMQKKIPVYEAEDRLMMQSELENLKSVFDEAKEWSRPDYMALAFFLLQKGSADLAEMENSQRNAYIERVFTEGFWDKQAPELEKARVLEKVQEFERQMLR